ncbi:FGGY family carbohydrate kinase [Lacipirellula limnantheis]|uniref:ATP:glycerol 3-phosphotransferase n=1 Tax=Lacipirellula limnantheis TaxID=2528024 RepID=A0A517U4R8_9BACT|nr:FGGY family carbohydrate kinase [Lacipirellula limnantheis]QDT75618.1 Glycerol kinase [Lacipirellula limnantheis]
MSAGPFILAIDQGTTSTKSILLNAAGRVCGAGAAARRVDAAYPRPGWVEFDPAQLLASVEQSAAEALRLAGITGGDVAAIGMANQGETCIAFDARTGRPIGGAISWQDRRGEELIDEWRAAGLADEVVAVTGLRLDAYFTAAKLAWLLRHVPEARELRAAGRLRYGTSDAWLLWQLTGGRNFATDGATASRTMLYDLTAQRWSGRLLEACGLDEAALPSVAGNAEVIGATEARWFGREIPIAGLCVDQQAALFGQGATRAGQAKITYGTGCFVLANAGADGQRRAEGLLTSVGWRLGAEPPCYVFDGGVYSAGSLVEWLCTLGLAADAADASRLAGEVETPGGVMLVPAFSGLGAPRWASRARACWLGMDQGTDRRMLARAALEAIGFSVKEIVERMSAAGVPLERIDVDGGLTRSDLLMQMQADMLGVGLRRREMPEATALGAGYLAGIGCGLWRSDGLPAPPSDEVTLFEPRAAAHDGYVARFEKWQQACDAVIALGDAGGFES